MSKLNYSVDGKYRWSGTFYLEIRIGKKSVFHTIGGSLTYSKNEGFNSELVLLFHEDTFKLAKIIEEGVAVKVIVARLIDADTGNAVNATMFNPNPSLAKNSLMTVIRNAASIDKAFSYVS
jgi:hypothetical protein